MQDVSVALYLLFYICMPCFFITAIAKAIFEINPKWHDDKTDVLLFANFYLSSGVVLISGILLLIIKYLL